MSIDLLIDTSHLIWFLTSDPRAGAARDALRDDASTVTVSAVSLSEIAIKATTGKLHGDVGSIRAHALEHGFLELSWNGGHAEALAELPLHHRDPFDRMLIAQAQVEGMTIATSDRAFDAYDVALLDR